VNTIRNKILLNPSVIRIEVEAPRIARKALPGQFVILRVHEDGERIPLTIAKADRDAGTITLVFQEVGKTTRDLGALAEGDAILDLAGPLGQASHLEGIQDACVIGGGLGTAIAWPQAGALAEAGARVRVICGFRNRDLILLEEEMARITSDLAIVTDDGSNGTKGFVTHILQKDLEAGRRYDAVIAVGPLVMMKAVSELTRPYGIRTIVSMNPVMIDGTGMCGGCRLTVGGKTVFACVDGPEFDGHQVDFDEAIRRSAMYRNEERLSESRRNCRLEGMNNA